MQTPKKPLTTIGGFRAWGKSLKHLKDADTWEKANRALARMVDVLEQVPSIATDVEKVRLFQLASSLKGEEVISLDDWKVHVAPHFGEVISKFPRTVREGKASTAGGLEGLTFDDGKEAEGGGKEENEGVLLRIECRIRRGDCFEVRKRGRV
jgi:hypothetical protein